MKYCSESVLRRIDQGAIYSYMQPCKSKYTWIWLYTAPSWHLVSPVQDWQGIPEASMLPKWTQRRPRGVPEASRRRPRMSKKRPGDAKFDLVVFYSVFKRLYSSKWDPEGAPKASRASKMSPNASQKRPKGVQKKTKNVKKTTWRRKARFSRVL